MKEDLYIRVSIFSDLEARSVAVSEVEVGRYDI